MAYDDEEGSTFEPTKTIRPEAMGYWWDLDRKKAASIIFDTVKTLRDEQTYIESTYRNAISLYENVDIDDLDAWNFATTTAVDGPYQYNVIESIVDTVHSEIISNRTKVQFVTYGGDWLATKKGESLTKFTAGIFHDAKVYENVIDDLVCDALVFGSGFTRPYLDNNKRVQYARVFPYNLVFDDVEASNGPIQTIYEVRLLSRQLLMREFDGNAEAKRIIASAPEHRFKSRPKRTVTDVIKIIVATHVGTEENPGRTITCTQNGVLIDEEYEKEKIPFVHLRYKKRRKGFLGKGIPEILSGNQEVINSLRERINAQLTGPGPFLWTKTGSQIREADLTNEIYRHIESEEMPEVGGYETVSPSLTNQFQAEEAGAASLIGVNLTMLKSEMPSGLQSGSGKAQRTYNDTKSKRYMRFARETEAATVELASQTIDLIEEESEDGEGYKVGYPEDGGLEEIDFKDIKLPRNSFIIRAMPVNFLSDTPSGQLSDIESLAQIFPEQLKPYLWRQIRSPDIEKITKRMSSDTDAIERILGGILDGKTKPNELPPIPFMDLKLAVSIGRQLIVESYSQGAPDDKLQGLIDWVSMAEKMIPPPPAPPMPMGLPPGMPPPGPPADPTMLGAPVDAGGPIPPDVIANAGQGIV